MMTTNRRRAAGILVACTIVIGWLWAAAASGNDYLKAAAEKKQAEVRQAQLEQERAKIQGFLDRLTLPRQQTAYDKAKEALRINRETLAEVEANIRRLDAITSLPMDSSTVDLRHLDPGKGITVDPNVVKRGERQIAVQVSEKTLSHPNYIKGFEAIKVGEVYLALEHLEKAVQELGDDPLAINARDFAADLVKLEKERLRVTTAVYEEFEGAVAEFRQDFQAAERHYRKAVELDPTDPRHKAALEQMKSRLENLRLREHLDDQVEKREKIEDELEGYTNAALMAMTIKKYDRAVSFLEKKRALENTPATVRQIEILKALRDGKPLPP